MPGFVSVRAAQPQHRLAPPAEIWIYPNGEVWAGTNIDPFMSQRTSPGGVNLIWAYSETEIYASTDTQIFKSTDRGLTWTLLTVTTMVPVLAVSSSELYGRNDATGTVQRSTDIGQTWTTIITRPTDVSYGDMARSTTNLYVLRQGP